jgi:hypothetical protein
MEKVAKHRNSYDTWVSDYIKKYLQAVAAETILEKVVLIGIQVANTQIYISIMQFLRMRLYYILTGEGDGDIGCKIEFI